MQVDLTLQPSGLAELIAGIKANPRPEICNSLQAWMVPTEADLFKTSAHVKERLKYPRPIDRGVGLRCPNGFNGLIRIHADGIACSWDEWRVLDAKCDPNHLLENVTQKAMMTAKHLLIRSRQVSSCMKKQSNEFVMLTLCGCEAEQLFLSKRKSLHAACKSSSADLHCICTVP